MRMLATDTDGHVIVDYLGREFRKNVPGRSPAALAGMAHDFIRRQLGQFRSEGEQELASRYETLSEYFEERLPLWVV